MMSKAEQYEKIEDYLKGRLSAEEHAAFEKQIELDNAFEAEVELHRSLMEATGEEKVIAYEQQIRDIFAEADTHSEDRSNKKGNNKPGSSTSRWIWGFAILLVFGIAAWYLSHPSDSTPQNTASKTEINAPQKGEAKEQETDLPQDENNASQEKTPQQSQENKQQPGNAKKIENDKPIAEEKSNSISIDNPYQLIAMAEINALDVSAIRTKGDEQEKGQLDAAYEAYENSSYQQVVQLLSDTPLSNKTEYIYLRGHAYLQLQKFDEAAREFTQLTNSFAYGYDADWNLLLSLAAQLPKSQQDYEAQLAKVTKSGHPFAEQARALRKKLEDAGLNQ